MKKEKPIDLFNQPKVKKSKEKVIKEPKPKKTPKSVDRDPSVILNPQQEEAIILLKEFLKDDTKNEFTIKGSGGSGKTFLIKELFKRKKQNKDEWYVPSTVIGVCVTHMARLNLMKSIPNTTTYASAANLQMMFDPESGSVYFIEKYSNHALSELKSYKYVVVDECSMFDDKMLINIRNCCDENAKIIYLGDDCQLPPIESIGDDDSRTFDLSDQYELTIKMRQDKDDHIAILGDQVREHIKGDHDISFLNDLKQQWDPIKNKGYSVTTIANVITSYVKNFNNGLDVRITSYRNKRIEQLNTMIRTFLWDDLSSFKYVPGEYIVMNEQYSINREILAYCGQSFHIKTVHIEMVEFVECYMIIVPKWNRKPKSRETITLQVPTEKGYVTYKRHLEKLRVEAVQKKEWYEYSSFKGQFANISYGYAMSNYKIQGSTIKGCYVDLSDILNVKPISNKRKLQAFYVGISRPTDFLAIF
jgi:hypothetical protein